jgi:MoxR-like ATPase
LSQDQTQADTQALNQLRAARDSIRKQLSQVIVGQDEVVEQLLVSLFARGHCILEGVPGLAKTLLISTLAQCLSLKFSRIQFTPDLMPTDITGTEVMYEDQASGHREFRFVHGPIFANVLLADEINRTPPKTQAALLEGMQERQVSAGGQRHKLPDPFFVLATQNPIEQEGTYPLPEAQLDRFLCKVFVRYPTQDEEKQIYRMSVGGAAADITPVISGEDLLALQATVRKVPISDYCLDYVVALIRATRSAEATAPAFVKDWVLWGVGPRGGQALIATAKARAALDGRPEVDISDLKAMAKPVLRHRIVLNYNAEAQGETPDSVIEKLVNTIPTHGKDGSSHGRVESVLKA